MTDLHPLTDAAFDPRAVRGYRLLGYENRDIADRDLVRVRAKRPGGSEAAEQRFFLERTSLPRFAPIAGTLRD